ELAQGSLHAATHAPRKLGDVGAGREGATDAGQDHGPDGPVVLDRVEQGREAVDGGVVECVELVRAIEGEDGDAVPALEQNGTVGVFSDRLRGVRHRLDLLPTGRYRRSRWPRSQPATGSSPPPGPSSTTRASARSAPTPS